MTAEGISESGSEKRRRGRPRSRVRLFADDLERHGLLSGCGCERSRTNEAYRAAAMGPALRLLTAEEQSVLLGMDKGRYMSGGLLPRGWSSAALEIGRLLEAIDADDETARGYLLVAVNARRDGVSWRVLRSHFRSLRLGERCGNARSLVAELAKTLDRYCSRFPATTDQTIADAVRVLCGVVSKRIAPEPGSPAENDLTICDL
jgi:hypothetical protein